MNALGLAQFLITSALLLPIGLKLGHIIRRRVSRFRLLNTLGAIITVIMAELGALVITTTPLTLPELLVFIPLWTAAEALMLLGQLGGAIRIERGSNRVIRRMLVGRWMLTGVALALVGAGALSIAACGGGEDDDDGGGGPTAAATATPGKPGTVTVALTGSIKGQKDHALLIFAAPGAGGPNAARACIRIESDDFTFNPTLLTEVPAGNDPCSGSTASAVLAEGNYTVTAGVYAPPAQQPDKQTSKPVTVGKDAVTVTLDGAALSR